MSRPANEKNEIKLVFKSYLAYVIILPSPAAVRSFWATN